MKKPIFIRKKCPKCGAKMALADNSSHVSSMYFLNSEILLIVGLIVMFVFNDSVFGWIVGGIFIIGFFIWIMIDNPYRDFECSECSYSE